MAISTFAGIIIGIQEILLIIGSGLTGFKVGQASLLRYLREHEETSQGPFRTVFKVDGQETPAERVAADLGEEEVVCVKRCCCSLTRWFPSGVFTVATWLLAGTAVRHEFVLLHTTNFVILIEIGLNGRKENSWTYFHIKSARSNVEKIEAEKELLQEKWWVRTMKELKDSNLGKLRFYQINWLIRVWIIVSRAGGCNYTVIQKNCKSLARSILYFSKESPNYWDILYSLWGIFTDKPFHIFHPEGIIAEKSAFNGFYYATKDLKILAEMLLSVLQTIRTHKLDKEEFETFCE